MGYAPLRSTLGYTQHGSKLNVVLDDTLLTSLWCFGFRGCLSKFRFWKCSGTYTSHTGSWTTGLYNSIFKLMPKSSSLVHIITYILHVLDEVNLPLLVWTHVVPACCTQVDKLLSGYPLTWPASLPWAWFMSCGERIAENQPPPSH